MCFFAAAALPGVISAGAALSSAGAVAGVASAGTAAAAGVLGTGLSALQLGSLALSVIGTGAGIFSKFQQASGQKAQMAAQAKIAKNNQTVANWQAQDALKRGADAELQNRRKYAQLAGTQRADFASRGVDLNEGSPLAELDDTYVFQSADSNTIKENSAREAWGFRNQASNYGADVAMYDAGAGSISPLLGAGGSLLTGATDVSEKWYRFKSMSPAV
jgi:hypothetical protein